MFCMVAWENSNWHQGTTLEAVLQAKAAINDVVATQAAYGSCQTLAQIQGRDADNKALMDLFRAVDKKVWIVLLLINSISYVICACGSNCFLLGGGGVLMGALFI